MKVYLSGPMTGYPNLNFDAFHAAAAMLRDRGYTVVNPAEINPDLNADWFDCIIEDIKAMKDCDAIYHLYGWEKSPGAQIEHWVAQKQMMTNLYEEDYDFQNCV